MRYYPHFHYSVGCFSHLFRFYLLHLRVDSGNNPISGLNQTIPACMYDSLLRVHPCRICRELYPSPCKIIKNAVCSPDAGKLPLLSVYLSLYCTSLEEYAQHMPYLALFVSYVGVNRVKRGKHRDQNNGSRLIRREHLPEPAERDAV